MQNQLNNSSPDGTQYKSLYLSQVLSFGCFLSIHSKLSLVTGDEYSIDRQNKCLTKCTKENDNHYWCHISKDPFAVAVCVPCLENGKARLWH